MIGLTIESILAERCAWYKGEPAKTDVALSRADFTQIIAANYAAFELARDEVIRNTDAYLRGQPVAAAELPVEALSLIEEACRFDVTFRTRDGLAICETQGRKFLTGSWLEELAWLAANAAGASEAVFGQNIGWKVKEFSGENEIDLIMRKDERLSFVSCKALRSELDIADRKHRNRLMDAVHEADNLADHFGAQGDKVGVLVTTDLIDEVRGAPRYNALMGKAAILDVRIIPLEELAFDRLTAALRGLLSEEKDVAA